MRNLNYLSSSVMLLSTEYWASADFFCATLIYIRMSALPLPLLPKNSYTYKRVKLSSNSIFQSGKRMCGEVAPLIRTKLLFVCLLHNKSEEEVQLEH